MHRRMRAVPALVAVLLIVVATTTYSLAASAQTPPAQFQFLEKRGAYAVGLKVVSQFDPSRKFPLQAVGNGSSSGDATGPRPIQTLIWYPASGHGSHTMTVGDYAQLARTEIHFDKPDASSKWVSKLARSETVTLWAERDASAAKGRFPVVIYAPGQSSVAWDNADLCEYLASQGYVVIASPSLGKSARDADDNLDDIDAEAADISFLIS